MMHRLIPLIVVVFAVLSVAPSHAASIRKRQTKEAHRIDRGVERGQLTPKETQRLQNQQNLITVERAQATVDGRVTKRERQDIRHDQSRLSKDIKHKRHNKRRVYQWRDVRARGRALRFDAVEEGGGVDGCPIGVI